jgi:hypothetical protein
MVRRETARIVGRFSSGVMRRASVLGVCAAAIVAAACGSSSRTSTGPTPLKCQPSVSLSTQSIGAGGGAATLAVTTQQECAWSVISQVAWITGLTPSSGQGSAQVAFSVATNPEASARQGNLVVNDQPISVRQEAAACRFEIAPKSRALDAGADEWEVLVTAVTGCPWQALSTAGWMRIKSGGSGTRDGVVIVEADTNPNQDPRTGSLTIAGETFAVAQSGTAAAPAPPPAPPNPPSSPAPPPAPPEHVCSYSLAPSTHAAAASGGSGSTSVQTSHAGCVWSVASDAAWLTPAEGIGVGSRALAFSVDPNPGAARTGHLTVAGAVLTVTQAAPTCSYSLNPTALGASAAGVAGSAVVVTTAAGCSWTAATTTAWITIAGGASGTGPGTVLLDVAVNSGAARSGSVTIAGQTVVVTQAAAAPPPPPACVYAINPASQSIGSAGGVGTIAVTTTASCGWTAATADSWITIVSGTSGSGNGSTSIVIATNPGAARTGTVTIAGHAYTVSQAAAPPPPPPPPPTCAYSIDPTSQSIGAGGANSRDVTVKTSGSCAWAAISNASWLTIESGASGQGSGKVQYDVASNSGPARQGTLTVAGLTFTVNQAGSACSYSISPSSASFSPVGGLGSVTVTATSACSWTATSNASWIVVTLGGGGTGNGSVLYSVLPNVGGSRTGTITIAGRTFTVSQN